jgi:pimeloyl-ACP methyl ester carboxylesterase
MKNFLSNKLVKFVALSLIALVVLVILGGGWYFSSVLEEDGLRVDNAEPENTVSVVAISDSRITLELLPDAEEDNLAVSARWGLTDGTNYGRLGDVISKTKTQVTRNYSPVIGEFKVGDELYLDRTAFPHDPGAEGLEYEEVVISSSVGEFGAWHAGFTSQESYTEETSDVWAVFVHGRTSNRETSLKLFNLPGVHSLAIDYRNDADAPPSESGYYDFGTTEWEDVEAAVQYALDHGAKKIVLVGFSMGGGVVINYQLKSELAEHTVGIVLDSPMLDFGRTVDKGAEERGVPAPITFAAKMFSTWRFGIDWSELDFLSKADEIDVPVILFHGNADKTVPIETSYIFAAANPDTVAMFTFEEVGHVATWNWYPIRYRSLVQEFVESVR